AALVDWTNAVVQLAQQVSSFMTNVFFLPSKRLLFCVWCFSFVRTFCFFVWEAVSVRTFLVYDENIIDAVWAVAVVLHPSTAYHANASAYQPKQRPLLFCHPRPSPIPPPTPSYVKPSPTPL
ncbi:unnamed protein product, partial [Laminaria digitata]